MDNRAIGVFDSGLGGLLALGELKRRLPNEDFIYFGDTGRMPYGDKSKEQLIKMFAQDVDFLRGLDVKVILAACGTVSSTALPLYVQDPALPVFGVIEPGAKLAAAVSKNRKVGVIATVASINGGAFQRVLTSLDGGLEITAKACPGFVPLIEAGHFDAADPLVSAEVASMLAPLRDADIDTLLLGCTHYPLMSEAIAAFMGADVTLVDSGAAAASELAAYISRNNLCCDLKPGSRVFYTSGDCDSFRNNAALILENAVDGKICPAPLLPL